MLAAFNAQQYLLVPKIADKARSTHVQLTEASYTTLIQSYVQLGAMDQAVGCLDQMTSEGLSPNIISYAAAIDACRSSPNVALQLLDRLKADGIQPNTVLLTSLINVLAKSGPDYADKAVEIFRGMENQGPSPNLYTFNCVIGALAEQGRLREALDVVQRMRNHNCSPDLKTYTTLLIACGRTKEIAAPEISQKVIFFSIAFILLIAYIHE